MPSSSSQNGMSMLDFSESVCQTPMAIRSSSRLLANTVSRSMSTARSDASVRPEPASVFKVRPIDRRIFESTGEIGVPKVEPRKVTEPTPFKFKTDQRLGPKERRMSGDSVHSVGSTASAHGYYLRSNSCEPPSNRCTTTIQRNRSCSAGRPAPVETKTPSLTVPISPKLRTAKRGKKTVMSTEELELRQIEEKKRLQREKMQMNKGFQKAFKASAKVASKVVRSTKPLTIPTSPVSRLGKRYGPKVCSLASAAAAAEATEVVRKQPEPAKAAHHGPTIPEPFQFKTDKRLKAVEKPMVTPMKTAAELAESFMKNARSQYVPETTGKRLTEAHSPVLQTNKRARTVAKPLPKSHEELELEAMSQMTAFKAKPVDKRIFESHGELGVAKVQPKPITEPQPFHFKTDARLGVKAIVAEEPFPTEVKEVKAHNGPTIPESPKFTRGSATAVPESRQKPHHSLVEREKRMKEQQELEALHKPMKLTEVKPFQLRSDIRGAAYQQELEERLRRQEELENEQKVIRAQPAPDFSAIPSTFQSAVKLPCTEVKEFHLASVKKHREFQQEFQKRMEAILHNESAMREVHATPVPNTLYEPDFQYEKVERTPLKPIQLNFATECRSEQRKKFDQQCAERMEESQKLAEMHEKMKEEEEEERIRDIRRKSVAEGGLMYKAAPIMRHDPYPTHPVKPKPLTEAVSPVLRTSKRARARQESQVI